MSTSSAEPLLNSRDYREVFVDTIKKAAPRRRFSYSRTLYFFAKIITPMGATGMSPKSYSLSVSRSVYLPSM